MKIKLTVIVVLLFPILTKAQIFQIDKPSLPIDSLKKALPLLHDSARVDCLNELSRSDMEEMVSMHPDSALLLTRRAYSEASSIHYIKGLGDASVGYGVIARWALWDFYKMEQHYREAISCYEKIGTDDGLGRAYLGLGDALILQDVPDEAKKAFEQSVIHFRKTGNRVMLAELIEQFGAVYNKKGDFQKWFEYVKMGLREKKRIGDKRGIVPSFYRLASIYQSVGDYETALDYFRLSFQQARSQLMQWHIYNSMGIVFFNLKNYDSSFYYFRKMYQYAPINAGAIVGMGRISLLRKEYERALQFFEEALTTFKKSNNLSEKTTVFVEMGKTHAEMKHYKTALQFARISLATALENDWKDVIQNAYEIYWNVYEALHQKDSAYFYYRKFVTLKDTLNDARLKLQHLQKLALYKVEAKEEEQQARIALLDKDNQIKQQQLQEESLQKKILVGSLATLVLLGIILFRNAILKRKNEKHRRELAENELQIQKLEGEKTKAELQQQAAELEMQVLRAQMNPHFIFNCLSSINHFILKNETATASDYLTRFSSLIRMGLNNSKHKYVTLSEELDCLELHIQLEQLRFKNSFRYIIKCSENIDTEDLLVPPLLLQPFVENAIWHGLMLKKGTGKLDIRLQLKEEALECTITDNGIGRKAASDLNNKTATKYKSMGLQITQERIALLDKEQGENSIAIEDLYDDTGNASGTKVTLRIKCGKPSNLVESLKG
jgi:tetratricopeptide (TPR) repeat protein